LEPTRYTIAARRPSAHLFEVACTIDGKPWTQKPFPYQAKCLQALRAGYDALGADDRRAVASALAGTGSEVLFA